MPRKPKKDKNSQRNLKKVFQFVPRKRQNLLKKLEKKIVKLTVSLLIYVWSDKRYSS